MPFTPSSQLQEAVRKSSKSKAREALNGYILSDVSYTSRDLDEAVNYLRRNGLDPFEPYSEEETGPLDLNQAHWDEKYQGRVQSDLMDNFSERRLNHWKAVAQVVGRQYHKSVQQAAPKVSTANPTRPTANLVLLAGIAVGVIAVVAIVLLVK